MKIQEKKELLQLIETVRNLQEKIKNNISSEDEKNVLINCQEAAIAIGTEIEKNYSDNIQIVHELEQYCELIYEISQIKENVNKNIVYIKLEEKLRLILQMVERIKTKYRVAFFPYKADMWDSLESIWEEFSKDERFESAVVVIPYFSANRQNGEWEYHYDADRFPKNVPIVSFKEYSLNEMKPDLAFIHNPFDKYNLVTSVHPDYYSSELKKYIKKLVYVPYYVNSGFISDQYKQLPALLRCDNIVVQSQLAKKSCEGELFYDKVVALGSPKFDKVINNKDKHNIPPIWKDKARNKKMVMLNTTIADLLKFDDGDMSLIYKLKDLFNVVSNRNDIVVIWRPHPLLEATIKSLRVKMMEDYKKLVEEFINGDYGIYDDTADVSSTIACTDAYIGSDYSSIINMFEVLGKPIYLLDSRTVYGNLRGNISAEQAFNKPLVYQYYAARESADYTLNNFLDDLVNDNLEKVIADEIIASKELAENIDGTSGKAIYRYFAEELIKEDIYNG